MSDVRYALRSLLRARWFTAAAVLTFALGIGVNIAVFSVVDRLLFRALPYNAADELVLLRSCDANECAGGFPSVVAFEGRTRLATIDGIAVAAMPGAIAAGPDERPLRMSGVSANLLHVLGVQPVLGRDFTDDDVAQTRRVALVGYDAWQRRFAGSPDVIRQSVGTGPRRIHIVGVLPEGFIPPTWTAPDPEWDGFILDATGWAGIGPTGMIAVPVARLAPGASVAAAQAEVDALVAALATDLARPDGRLPAIQVDPIQRALFSRFRSNAWLILAAAIILLLLACANLGTLLLARGRSREHAAAIHASLGATPARLVTTAACESVVVCLAGAAVAIAAVSITSKALLTVLPPLLARYTSGATDTRVLGAALLAALACALAAGTAPALRVARVDVLSALRQASGHSQRARVRGGRSLLAIEAALGVLLVLSGLLVFNSFKNLAGDDLGFNPDGLYAVTLRWAAPSDSAPIAPRSEAGLAVYEQALVALRGVPGVRSAGGADSPVGSGEAPKRSISKDVEIQGGRFQISAGYFETLQTPLLAGRSFSEAEVRSRAAVGILSVSAARAFFPDLPLRDVIGRALTLDDDPVWTIVGVVPDFKGHHGEPAKAAFFVPQGSAPSRFATAVIRMDAGSVPQLALIRQRIAAQVGPATISIAPVSARLEPWLRDPRFRMVLFSVLALAALLLAAVGLYAVASFDVAQRRYEMGVRLSLGARARDIERLVIGQACWPVMVGIAMGLAGAHWAEAFLASFLYEVAARDPVAYATVIALFLGMAVLAAWVPARRAARLDPTAVLRSQ